MLSITIGFIAAMFAVFVGASVANLTSDKNRYYSVSFTLTLAVIAIIQATWLYIPIGFNFAFIFTFLVYFNLGYFLVSCNIKELNDHESIASNLKIWAIGHVVVFLLYLITSGVLLGQAQSIGTRGDVERLEDKAAINDFYYEALEGNVRYIPFKTAKALATKALSESTQSDVTLGSVLQIRDDAATIDVINGETYWVFPLEYIGFLKQTRYGDIDAYIIVNALKQSAKAELIRSGLDRNANFAMKQSIGGYFHRNLIRKFYSNNPATVVSKFKIIIDDNFTPHMIAYAIKPGVGVDNYVPDGIVLYDFNTETFTRYTSENAPEWVEVLVDINTNMGMINDWGEYRKGFIESIGSTFATELTDYTAGTGTDMFFVPTKNGFAWFSGMTSTSSTNDSIVDVVFTDTRTGKTTIIKSKGVDENGIVNAVEAALGKDADKWSSVMPIKYLINKETEIWITPIVSDKTNLVIKMAVVDAQNINRVAVGDDLQSALNKFAQMGDFQEKMIESMDKEVVSGIVDAFNIVGFNESIISYIRFVDSPETVIECNTSAVKLCLVLKEGDNVSIEVFTKENNIKVVTGLSLTNNTQ